MDLQRLLEVPYVYRQGGFGLSPDGEWVAFCWNPSGRWELHLQRREPGAQPRPLTAGPGAKLAPRWSPDGRTVAYLVDLDGGEAHDIFVVDSVTGAQRNLTPDIPYGIHYDLSWSPDGRHVAFAADRDGRFDTYVVEVETGALRKVLDQPCPDCELAWSPDGRWIAVMTEGHGDDYWTFIVPVDGGEQDLLAGADFLIEQGLADPARIVITGRSYGGYLTMVCLTRYPNRWAAGSAVVPFLNWLAAQDESREDLQHWAIENMGDPETHAELWRERSPFFFLDRVMAPVQFICAGNDPRCPASDPFAARDVLLELGKAVDLRYYDDEGHSFLKRENVLDAETRRADFLKRAVAQAGPEMG